MKMKNVQLNNRGTTLIELVVSMGIFSAILTMSVGFFLNIQKLQAQYREMTNMQEEGRFTSELFSRITREAYSVSPSIGTSNLDICDGTSPQKFIALQMSPTTTIAFACNTSNPRRLGMVQLAKSASSVTAADLTNLVFITTSQVNMQNFKIRRDTKTTYPKTLMYNFQMAEQNSLSSGSPGTGEMIYLEGFLNMRNEL